MSSSSVFNLRMSDLDKKKKSKSSIQDVSLSYFIKNNNKQTRKLHVSDLKSSALRKLHVSDLKSSALKKSSFSSPSPFSSSKSKSKSSGKLRLSDLGKKKKTSSSSTSSKKLSLKDLLGGKKRKSRRVIIGGAHDYDGTLSTSDIEAIKQSNGMYDIEDMNL